MTIRYTCAVEQRLVGKDRYKVILPSTAEELLLSGINVCTDRDFSEGLGEA